MKNLLITVDYGFLILLLRTGGVVSSWRESMNRRWILAGTVALFLALPGCGSEGGTSEIAPDDQSNDIVSDIGWLDLDTFFPDVQEDKDLTELDFGGGIDVDVWDPDPEDIEDVQNPKDTKETIEPDVLPEEVSDPGVAIADLQDSEDSLECKFAFGSMLIGVDITLKDVVVTAGNYPYVVVGEPMAGFYVADPGGEDFSGIHVSYPAASAPELHPGMILTLVGDHKESACFTNFQAKNSIVIVNPNGEPPVPTVVTPAEIMEDPEVFEGMFLRVESVTVTDPNPDSAAFDDKRHFLVNDVLRVGNDYKVPYMTPPTDERTLGDEFHYIVGVLRWIGEDWVLMPRSGLDMWRMGDEPPVDVGPEIVEQPVEGIVEEVPDVVETVEYVEYVEEEPDVVDVPDVPDDTDVPDIDEDVPADVPPQDTMPDIEIPEEPDSPIVITEIMYDPASPIFDDKGEWFEIINASKEPVDLNGWRISSEDGNMHIIQYGAPFWIQPNQILVFGNQSIESQNGGVEIDYMYPSVDFSLDNGMDSVVLMNVYGFPIDSVHYNENMSWPEGFGASIELYHQNLDNENPANWKVATVPYGDGTQL